MSLVSRLKATHEEIITSTHSVGILKPPHQICIRYLLDRCNIEKSWIPSFISIVLDVVALTICKDIDIKLSEITSTNDWNKALEVFHDLVDEVYLVHGFCETGTHAYIFGAYF